MTLKLPPHTTTRTVADAAHEDLRTQAGPSMSFRALEPRIAFDAAMAEAIDQTNDVAIPAQAPAAADMPPLLPVDIQALAGLLTDAIDSAASQAEAEATDRSTIVFIDAAITSPALIAAAAPQGAEIVVLEAGRDGVAQIASHLAGRSGIDAVHIISHGEVGELRLGSSQLNLSSISGQHADELSSIRSALSEDADILIYGCDVSAGEAGAAFVTALATATGADIAASTDDTGHASRAGDWDLETRTGLIEAGLIDAPEWNGLLAPFNISASTAPVVRDNTGAVVSAATGGDGVTRHVTDLTKMVGTTALWQNAGFVGSTAIDLRATVISVLDTNPNAGQDPTLNFAVSNGDDASVRIENAEVRIRWDAFAAGTYNPTTGTGVVAQGDVGFFIRDIDAQGHLYSAPGVMTYYNMTGIKPQESVRAEFDQLYSYQSEAPGITHLTIGLNIDPDTGLTVTNPADPSYGKITATNLVDTELAGSESGVKFNWNNVSSWEVTYRVAPPPGVLQFDAVPTNGVADGSLTGTSHGQRFFDHDGDGDLSFVSASTAFMRQLDLDADNSTQTGTGYQTTFTENGSAVAVVDVDVDITGLDSNIASATISLTNAKAGDQLLVNGSAASSGTVNGLAYTVTNTGGAITIQLTGATTDPSIYEAALNQIRFTNTSEAPDAADRLIEVTFNNGSVDSNTALSTIHVTPVNDAPVAIDDGPITAVPLSTLNINVLPDNGSGADSDVDGDALFVTGIVDPANQGVVIAIGGGNPSTVTLASGTTVTLKPDGTLDVVMSPGNSDTETFDYRISDGNGGTDTATVTLARDSDADGIINATDIDDDNDGILDTVEGLQPPGAIATVPTLSGIAWMGDTASTVSAATNMSLQSPSVSAYQIYPAGTSVNDSNVLDVVSGDRWVRANSGSVTISWSTPVPANEIAFYLFDMDRGTYSASFSVTGAAGTTDFALYEKGSPGPTSYNSATGVLDISTPNDDFGDANVEAYLVGTSSDLVSSITISFSGGVNSDLVAVGLFAIKAGAIDSDNDGLHDHLDIDSDNDGITDNVEAQSTAGYIAPSGTDTDADGLDDAYDATLASGATGSNGLASVDTDSDGIADALDADSDSDGTADIAERGDGQPTSLTSTTDTDADGLLDIFEGGNANDGFDVNDKNLSGTTFNLADTDNDTAANGAGATPLINDLDYRDNNEPPVATDDTLSTNEDTNLSTNIITANGIDSDPDSDLLTIVSATIDIDGDGNQETLPLGTATPIIVGGNTIGTLSLNPTGGLIFAPEPNFHGAIPPITYTLSDGSNQTDTAVVHITVNDVNDPPIATASTSSGNEDTDIPVNLAGTDIDGTIASVTVTSLPPVAEGVIYYADGTTPVSTSTPLTPAEAASLVFVPATNFNGTVTIPFAVTDNDGAFSTPANEVIIVNAVNDAPVDGDETNTVAEDGTLIVADGSPDDLLANASDPDGNTPVITSFTINGVTHAQNSIVAIPGVGNIRIQANGAYSFSPLANFNGAVPTITYTLTDGFGLTDTSTLDIMVTPVTDAPVAINDTASGAEDAPIAGNVIGNDTDADGDTLTVQDFAVGGNTYAPGTTVNLAEGDLTVNTDGTFTFTPAPNFNGSVPQVTYTATDSNGGTDAARLNITVTPVNDAPIAMADTNSGTESQLLSGNVIAGTVASGSGTGGPDTDIDGGALTVTALSTGAVGAPIALTYGTLTIQSNGSYSFVPNATANTLDQGQVVTQQITYTVSDGNGGTAQATLTLTLTGENDAPFNALAIPASTTTDGGTVSIPTFNAFNDPDGEPLEFSLAPGTPAWLSIDPNTGLITNNAPVPANASISGSSSNGVHTIGVIGTDPNGAFVEVTVTLTIVNLPPVAQDDAASLGEDDVIVAGNVITDVATGDADTAPDADPLVVTGALEGTTPLTLGVPFTTAGGGALTLNANGSYTFAPGTAYNGLDVGETATETVTYTVSDGNGGTDTALLVITINGANDAPVIVDPANPGTPDNPIPATDPLNIIPDVATTDGAPFTPIAVGTYVVDPDGEPLTFALDPATTPAWLAIDPVTGTITGTPPADASQLSNTGTPGAYLVTVTATDPDGTVATTTVTLTIINLPPVAQDDAAATVETGDTITIDVLANDFDPGPDSDALRVVMAAAEHGTVTINADGTISYVANPGYDGADVITYRISDDNGGFATASVQVTVTAIPIPLMQGAAGPDALPRQPASSEPIAVDGIVVDAVRGLAKNATITGDDIILDTVGTLRQNDAGDRGSWARDLDGYEVRGVGSFSLKLSTSTSSALVTLETFVRENVLVVHLDLNTTLANRQLVEWKVQRADGRPLPEWLSFAGTDILMGERAADSELLDLRIVGILSTGETIMHDVRIDTKTGELQPLKIGRSGALAPPEFWNQIQVMPTLTEVQSQELSRSLGMR